MLKFGCKEIIITAKSARSPSGVRIHLILDVEKKSFRSMFDEERMYHHENVETDDVKHPLAITMKFSGRQVEIISFKTKQIVLK